MLHRLTRYRFAILVCLFLFTDSPFAGAAQTRRPSHGSPPLRK